MTTNKLQAAVDTLRPYTHSLPLEAAIAAGVLIDSAEARVKAETELDQRHLDVLNFYRSYNKLHGQSPTLREAGDAMNVTSVTIWSRVQKLVDAGVMVSQQNSQQRNYVPVG